jgi:hypothetical protein
MERTVERCDREAVGVLKGLGALAVEHRGEAQRSCGKW